MNQYPEMWMYDNIEDCCSRYFGYNIIGCRGSDPQFVDPTEKLYYPDWEGTRKCINDGQAPAYMKAAYTAWMLENLTDCCARYYTWQDDYEDCVIEGGGTITPNTWYVDYKAMTCVKSCESGESADCGGVANPWNYRFDSKEECCEKKLWWLVSSCLAN